MVTEEIGLNDDLERRGLRVTETDLGEYIIQLRGERPSHILAPALHVSLAEVGETFERSHARRRTVPLTTAGPDARRGPRGTARGVPVRPTSASRAPISWWRRPAAR